MSVCDHEEADIKNNAQNVMVSTVDTYVIVILVGIFFMLIKQHSPAQIWVEFGKATQFSYF